ncbi:MAG: sodium:proton antiporter [Methylacidiphilales bacterium]|nr:sodium:proton antiporter [Candidatus Methylacidiphilales bacterium]
MFEPFLSTATVQAADPSPWMLLPFAALLLAIAIMPFANLHWWERHYEKVSLLLGAITVFIYLVVLRNQTAVLHTALDYVSFMALIGSLFVVAGGIHISVKGEASPARNCLFLLIGAVLANIIGTTGASMLMIRPWIRMNKYRITAYHTVFFIFIISNVSGCLTPIGDPPLFLGFLKGIPFWWTLHHLWIPWAVVLALLLTVFYFFDRRNFMKAPPVVRALEAGHETFKITGLHNIFFIAVVLSGIFFDPPWREGLMLSAAFGSYFTTSRQIHESNHFNFAPIREVGFLFLGIFATMMPALDYMSLHSKEFGLGSPLTYYFSCGFLSSVLDNAPTYLTFLNASFGLFVDPVIVDQVGRLAAAHGSGLGSITGTHSEAIRNTYGVLERYHADWIGSADIPRDRIETAYLLGNHSLYIIAISLGAVFFGAMTYIGNGPNLMVKSITERAGVKTPGFFGYLFKYALPILFPVLIAVGLVFLKFFPDIVR